MIIVLHRSKNEEEQYYGTSPVVTDQNEAQVFTTKFIGPSGTAEPFHPYFEYRGH